MKRVSRNGISLPAERGKASFVMLIELFKDKADPQVVEVEVKDPVSTVTLTMAVHIAGESQALERRKGSG